MIRTLKNKLFATLCITALTLGAVTATSTFNSVQAADKTVYVDVEKNVLGQAPIVQPKAVTIDDTKTVLDATKQAAGVAKVDAVSSAYGNYVSAFADTTHNFDKYKFYNQIDEATKGVVFRTDLPNQKIITDSNWLREKEYNGISGWMFTVNNTDNNGAGTYYTADTSLAKLPNGAVIRWEFSAAAGCDLGRAGYLPDGTVNGKGLYNWMYTPTDSFFTTPRANKTVLINKMANHANKTDAAYTNALTQLQTLQSPEADVNTAAAGL